MFKTQHEGRKKKSERTREVLLRAALRRFRTRGYERTTMRDIAEDAGLSLGAAYYYYPSKEALLFAYYAQLQRDHDARARALLASARSTRERLGIVLHSKLDAIRKDRRLLSALLPVLLAPHGRTGLLARETAAVRRQSLELFGLACAEEDLPADLQSLLGPALWLAHLAFAWFSLHDRSPRQERTRRLVDDTLDLMLPLLHMAASPAMAPLRERVLAILRNAGLLGAEP
jgi:AcrR family transcriptional regulator